MFPLALGLPVPWEVVDVAFDPKSSRIDFLLAFAPGPSPRGHDFLGLSYGLCG